MLDDGFDIGTANCGDREIVGTEMHHFVIIEVNDIGGAMGEGADVGCEEVFAVAEPYNKGRASTGTNQFSGAVFADDRDAEGPLYVREAFADGFEEAVFALGFRLFLVVVGDKVGKGFGIGLGAKGITLTREKFFIPR